MIDRSSPQLPPRYQFLSVLKESDRTCVYRVFDAVAGREEALKTICDRVDPLRAARVRTEFETLASIQHPNVVGVFDFGLLADGLPYFTMEYVAGRRITEHFDGHRWEDLYRIALQIAAALHHVHGHGVLHLDVKPANILVRDDGTATLMDFDLADRTERLSDRGIRGTLAYMAPEVLAQEGVDLRADLYSLGLTLYETVTGTLPGYGESRSELIRMRLDEPVRRAATINPRIPDALDSIIARLLERNPADRFPSAAALIDALAQAAGTAPVVPELLSTSARTYAAPLIGRDREVEALRQLIDGARTGSGGAVILAGREGTGKARIVREVTLRAQLDGAHVFCGRCPANRQTVYSPFIDVFQQMIDAASPENGVSKELDSLFRADQATGAEAGAGRGEKFRLYNRVVQSLEDVYGLLIASGRMPSAPLILVIENLQWADAPTAELFSFLVGEAVRKPLVVIGTLASDASGDEPPEARLADLAFWQQRAADGSLEILHVEPLTEHLVHQYIEALLGGVSVSDELARWVFWETRGIPLLIRRLIEHLAGAGHFSWTPTGWREEPDIAGKVQIPGGTGSLLVERLSGIDDAQRAVLEAGAVLGDRFQAEHLVDLCGDAETTLRALAGLLREGLLDESSDRRTCSFPHNHLRQTVYGSIAEPRRIELHRRAGEILERERAAGAPRLIGQVAFHLAQANDTARGSAASAEAGDLAYASLAFEEAGEFYRVALELMDLGGIEEGAKAAIREKLADCYFRRDDYRRALHVYQFLLRSIQARGGERSATHDVARISRKIGKVLARRGDIDGAMLHLQNALVIYDEHGDERDVVEVLNRIAWLQRQRDDLAGAAASAERAHAIVERLPLSPVTGYSANVRGLIEYARGNWNGSRALLERALAIGEETGSSHLRRVASTNLGNTLWKLGDWSAALEYFRRSAEQSEAEGDLWELVSAYNNVGVVEHGQGSFHAAVEMFEKSLQIGERIDASEHEAAARENLGEALEMLGRWPEAMEQYERCLQLESFDEERSLAVSVYVPLARLTRKRGDIARALEYAQKAIAAGERARDDDLLAEALHALSGIEEERDNLADAERHVSKALDLFERNGTLHGLARAHTTAASIAIRQHDVESALRHARAGEAHAATLRDRYTAARNQWVWGRIEAARGDRDRAFERFERAEQAFETLGCPYERARVLFDTGLLHDAPEEATTVIRGATQAFERLHAALDLERARGAMFRIRPAGKAAAQSVVGLYEIVKIINSTLQVEEVLNRVLDICLRRLRAERGLILLLDPITGALRTRVVRNLSEDADSRSSPQSVVREVIETGTAIVCADAIADERFVGSESVIADHILSIACVPLIIRERIAGAIYVDHRQARNLFAEKDLTFLEAFADQAAIAVANARLYEELEEARARLSAENETLRKELIVEKHLDSIVGESDEVARIQFAIRKAAAGHSTVLLRGESGTGKGLVARIIHNVGPRRHGPFIKFNCAALPETLAESELFGHEKGAFTGADRRKLGRFELAHNGTIFLDEIGKLSLAMQAKLLRVVEEKEFERVGGVQTIRSDVKIIAATNLDLERAIVDGTFREDLFYRLNIVPIVLPPLRERKQDVPVLAEHFMRKICKDLGIELKRLQPGIIEMFGAYDWPGNVRELEATLHRAIVMSNGDVITREEIANLFAGMSGGLRPEQQPAGRPAAVPTDEELTSDLYEALLAKFDRELISRALAQSGGRIREAARRLGLARNTLKAKMLRYQIQGRDN